MIPVFNTWLGAVPVASLAGVIDLLFITEENIGDAVEYVWFNSVVSSIEKAFRYLLVISCDTLPVVKATLLILYVCPVCIY